MSKEKEEEVLQKKLLKYKLISEKDLEEGLKAQRVMAELGIQKELREVLIDKGFISSEQLKARKLQKSIKYVIEGYTLLKKLGKGSMGVVYKARRNEDEALFAIKILSSHLSQDMNFIKRFLREAKHCIDLEHENIVKAYEVGFSNDRYYFTMEFIEGEDLRKKLNRTGPFQETEILAILTQISRALDYADSIKLIHRDIKPDNIIIDPQGVAKLCDLGLAKIGMSDNHSLTQAGMVVGTPFYISPEQCRGRGLDIRSDIYSLGATLYHMVTGQVPFNASDGIAILAKHVAEAPIPPKNLRPELSEDCNAILLRMMAKKPEDRYSPKTLLSEVANLRQQRKFETTLDMKFERPLRETANTEDTHFDLFEEMDTSNDNEDAEKGKESANPPPSVPHSSILLKRSKPEEVAQKTRSSSPETEKPKKSRKWLLLLIISLVGLSLVLLLILFQILAEQHIFDFYSLFSSSTQESPLPPKTLTPEQQMIKRYFPYEVFWEKSRIHIRTAFQDPAKSKFLWYSANDEFQLQPGKLVVQKEANCQIKFHSRFFSLKARCEFESSVKTPSSATSCKIRFLGYQLVVPLDGESPLFLCAQDLKKPLKMSDFRMNPGKKYEFSILKNESQITIQVDQKEILRYQEEVPLVSSPEHNVTNLIFKSSRNTTILFYRMDVEGEFHPDYVERKSQETPEKR